MNNIDPNYPNSTKVQFKFVLIEALTGYRLNTTKLAKSPREAFGNALVTSYRKFILNASRLDGKQTQSLERLYHVLTKKDLEEYYQKSLNLFENIDNEPDDANALIAILTNANTDINTIMSPYVFTDGDYSLEELVYCVVVIEKPRLLTEDEGVRESKIVKTILASNEIKQDTEKLIDYTIKVAQQ